MVSSAMQSGSRGHFYLASMVAASQKEAKCRNPCFSLLFNSSSLSLMLTLLALSYLSACLVALAGFSHTSCPGSKFAAILPMKTRPAFPHKKTRHLPSKPMKKRNSRWRMMLWTSMAVIGWFACKSLSDWVRYLVIVMCTGKSGIFRGQPVSLRGSNLDYSGRSASRVNSPVLRACIHNVVPFFPLGRDLGPAFMKFWK